MSNVSMKQTSLIHLVQDQCTLYTPIAFILQRNQNQPPKAALVKLRSQASGENEHVLPVSITQHFALLLR